MNDPFNIAVQGLAPGSTPIRITTQGFILSIAPAEGEDQDVGLVPLRSFGGPPDTRPYDTRRRRDLVVEVTGVGAGVETSGVAVEIDNERWEMKVVERALAMILEDRIVQSYSDLDEEELDDAELVRQEVEGLRAEVDELKAELAALKKPATRRRKK
jgi:hypothetical protein